MSTRDRSGLDVKANLRDTGLKGSGEDRVALPSDEVAQASLGRRDDEALKLWFVKVGQATVVTLEGSQTVG